MTQHPIELFVGKADDAINREDFGTPINIYADDAELVIKPGMNAVGKEQIRKSFEAIADILITAWRCGSRGWRYSDLVIQPSFWRIR